MTKRAAVVLQSHWRKQQACRRFQCELQRQAAARMIRRVWKRHQRTVWIRNQAATRIQSRWRAFRALIQHYIDKMDIIAVQNLFRRRKATRLARQRLNAVRVIQHCLYRLAIRRRIDAKILVAAVTCQVSA